MAKIKRTLTKIKSMTIEERKAIMELVSSNDKFKAAADAIQKIFASHFCFDENEIELFICNICDEMNEQVVATLAELYEEFVRNDIQNFDRAERRDYARGLVDNTLEIFSKENNKVKDEFIDVLREARALKVDPFKLAIKTNIQGASLEKFQNSLEALMVEKYYDKYGKDRELFTQEKTRVALEKCATIAYEADKQRTQEILNILNDLFYDQEKQAYVYDTREIIKDAVSILREDPKDLAETIKLLSHCKGMNEKTKLLRRIKASPALLTINAENIVETNISLADEIGNLLKKKPASKYAKFDSKKLENEAIKLSNNFTLDINHLTQLDKVKPQNVSAISHVLENYLGIDNAITCLQNINVIAENPDLLEFMLATLVKEEEESKLPLREYFVKNPYPFLAKARDDARTNGGGEDGNAISIERTKKAEITVKELPQVTISDEKYNKLKSHVNKASLGLTAKNLAKIKEEEERRRAEEARIEAERKRAEEENLKALRAERKANKQARKNAWKNIPSQETPKPAPTPQVAISQPVKEPKEELTLEQLQEIRRSRLKFSNKENVNTLHAFREAYLPIIDGFKGESPMPRLVAAFNNMCSAYEHFIHFKELPTDLINRTKALNAKLYEIMFNPETKKQREDIPERLGQDENGKSVGDRIVIETRELMDASKSHDSHLRNAVRNLDKSILSNPPFISENQIKQAVKLRDSLYEYLDKLESLAEEYYGKKIDDLLPQSHLNMIDLIGKEIQADFNPFIFANSVLYVYIDKDLELIVGDLLGNNLVEVSTMKSLLERNSSPSVLAREGAFIDHPMWKNKDFGKFSNVMINQNRQSRNISSKTINAILKVYNDIEDQTEKYANDVKVYGTDKGSVRFAFDKDKDRTEYYLEVPASNEPNFLDMIEFRLNYQNDESV